MNDTSDVALVERLPGFVNGYAEFGGVRLHYVTGGSGPPLFLIGGWPQTWWQFHHIMPALAERFHVVAVDMRGQGGSSRPDTGYDKKTMAGDIHALARHLGYSRIDIAGHDIGAMVAFSFLANHPDATRRAALLDVGHPFEGHLEIPILPRPGAFDLGNPNHPTHPWWFAFNQVPGLPEKLLEGRVDLLTNWCYDYLARNKDAISAFDRAVYAAAYEQPGGIRAANGWYQAFHRDIADMATYRKPTMPILGLARTGNPGLARFLSAHAEHAKVVEFEDCGHWLAEERPAEVVAAFLEFFG